MGYVLNLNIKHKTKSRHWWAVKSVSPGKHDLVIVTGNHHLTMSSSNHMIYNMLKLIFWMNCNCFWIKWQSAYTAVSYTQHRPCQAVTNDRKTSDTDSTSTH